MALFRTIRLSVPLITPAGIMLEVNVRKVRAVDFMAIERAPVPRADTFGKAVVLIEVLTDVPEGFARFLDMADFTLLAETIADAMGNFADAVTGDRRPHKHGRA